LHPNYGFVPSISLSHSNSYVHSIDKGGAIFGVKKD
jgi:hypothetical protein